MTVPQRFAFRFYLPLLLSLALLSLLLLAPDVLVEISQGLAGIKVPLGLGPVHFVLPLESLAKHIWVRNGAALLLASICALWALSVNFSHYVPNKLRTDAFFDVRGIERTIMKYFAREQRKGLFEVSWKDLIVNYDQYVLNDLVQHWSSRHVSNFPDIALISRDYIRAHGETNYEAERLGWLSYRISKCCGKLQYSVHIPKQKPFTFNGKFALQDSEANFIRPSFRELLRHGSVILALEFKQFFVLEEGGDDAPFDHNLVATTRLSLLPFPTLSNSLYLWQMPDGRTIPIGYCVYY